jgi:hypothetical protein
MVVVKLMEISRLKALMVVVALSTKCQNLEKHSVNSSVDILLYYVHPKALLSIVQIRTTYIPSYYVHPKLLLGCT